MKHRQTKFQKHDQNTSQLIMGGLDAFVWFRISSFIKMYRDLFCLSQTCRDLWYICKPIKKTFQEHYINRMKMLLKKQEKLVSKLNSMADSPKPEDLPEMFLNDEYNALLYQIDSVQKTYSDANFKKMLHRSKQKALLTCIERDLNSDEIYSIEFNFRINNSWCNNWCDNLYVNFKRDSDHCFGYLDDSIWSFAFNENKKILEDHNRVSWMGERNSVRSFLWFEKQSFSVESTMITTLSQYCDVEQYYVHQGKIYGALMNDVPMKPVCFVDEWDEYTQKLVFIAVFQPLTQEKIDWLNLNITE
jgi:hypothetical protein